MPVDSLDFTVRHAVHIHAPPDVVFDFFADNDKLAMWFGAGSRLDPRPGGVVEIAFPDGSRATGHVLELERPRRIVFTWGYPRDNTPLAPGASRVEVTLEPRDGGTFVTLVHRLPTELTAQQHAGGWAYHMARLATGAARSHFAGPASAAIDHWFAAWCTEGEAAAQHLQAAVTDDVVFRDDAAIAANRAELADHIARCHRFMKGVRLVAAGPVFQCADFATCSATLAHGERHLAAVRLVFSLAPDGRIRQATGFFETALPGVTAGTAIGGSAPAHAPAAREPRE